MATKPIATKMTTADCFSSPEISGLRLGLVKRPEHGSTHHSARSLYLVLDEDVRFTGLVADSSVLPGNASGNTSAIGHRMDKDSNGSSRPTAPPRLPSSPIPTALPLSADEESSTSLADTVTVVFVGLLALYLVGELILAKLRGGTGNKDAHRAGSRVAEGDGNEEKPHRQQVAVSKKAIRTAGEGQKGSALRRSAAS